MNTTPNATSFFSFGKNDSYISKSFAGLKCRNLHSALQDLIYTRAAADIHWAALGPRTNSWIVSLKEASGKNALRWGADIPERLETILNKTWHAPHLHVFLGPYDSFIIWHPDLIRWANLPPRLEDALQSWLTPAGWRAGPPRMVTWGPEGAFFAMSEYGNVLYNTGDHDAWEIYQETADEWKAEKGFSWSELAFIALDPTITDQFIAVRNDGTWAGSIEDANEDALEIFALNFFARAKSKHKAKASTSSSNGGRTYTIPKLTPAKPDAATQALYETWSKDTAALFNSATTTASGSASIPKTPRKVQIRSQSSSQAPKLHTSTGLLITFPYLPDQVTICALTACIMLKEEPNSIKACQHDVEKLLRASGLYSYEWLRQERLRWHPDRFGRLCDETWKETGKKMAGEMFKLMGVLIEEIGSQDEEK